VFHSSLTEQSQKRFSGSSDHYGLIGILLIIIASHRADKSGVFEAIFQPLSTPVDHWDYWQLAHLDFNQFVFTNALPLFFRPWSLPFQPPYK